MPSPNTDGTAQPAAVRADREIAVKSAIYGECALNMEEIEPFGTVHGIEENGPFQVVGRWYD
jgi:hypothetical protein